MTATELGAHCRTLTSSVGGAAVVDETAMSISLRKRKPKPTRRLSHDKLLDSVGWKLLRALQADARLSSYELGAQVGLSAPAAAERVRRMEQAGLIAGYRAVVPLQNVGLSILAFIRVVGASNDRYYERMQTALRAMPRVLEAHHVAGDDSFIIKVAVADVQELEHVIAHFTRLGHSVTSIVLSTLLTRDTVEEPRRLTGV
jgi:Lrp/AsnC family leucine-responsive transcriptional regulator